MDKFCELFREFSIHSSTGVTDESFQKVKNYLSQFNHINIQAGKFIGNRADALTEPLSNKKQESIFKVEKMKLPQFDGDIRSFPRFISDIRKFILPNISNHESASYVLRSCLSGVALEAVKSIDDNLEQMLERLNDKFGRPSKLADVIMNDIKQTRAVSDGDERTFVKFVNLIESSYKDLSRIGMEREISNSTIVSLVEEKLPKTIKNQWCLHLCDKEATVDDKTNFLNFSISF